MSLTGKDIADIARLLDSSHFTSLDLKQGDFRLRIRRDGGNWDEDGRAGEDDERSRRPRRRPAREEDFEDYEDEGAAGEDEAAGETRATAEPGVEPAPEPAPRADSEAADTPAGDGEVDVIAPLMGNFYSAPRPGEPPFVNVGDRVEEDSVVAIIEVMKLMNSVRAGVAGTVSAVLVENGSAVEDGQPLLRVRAD